MIVQAARVKENSILHKKPALLNECAPDLKNDNERIHNPPSNVQNSATADSLDAGAIEIA